MDFKTGGQEVIKRLLEVYGFNSRQALAAHLGVSAGTMGTRWMRDFFPADWVIQCAIETGASVEWLSLGKGEKFQNESSEMMNEALHPANENCLQDVIALPRIKIVDGHLFDSSFVMFDKVILPRELQSAMIVVDKDITYLTEKIFSEVTDGKWLVEIEGITSIREITKVPVGKIQVSSASSNFICDIEEITIIAKCLYTLLTDISSNGK